MNNTEARPLPSDFAEPTSAGGIVNTATQPPTGEPDQPRIAESITAEVLAASIAARDLVTLSILVHGTFRRPDTRVEIANTVIVATIPATIFADAHRPLEPQTD